MSDCNSDWQFYEHLNMKRILEDHSQDTGDGFIVYMYGGHALSTPSIKVRRAPGPWPLPRNNPGGRTARP